LIEESQAKLREQHQLLQAAVDNMTDALIMFDATARMVVCNRRYLEMYRVSSDVVKPGLALRDLLIHREANGGFSGDIDEYIADSLASTATGNPSIKIKEFADGRVIQIKDQPMASGGWVAIHEDITERRMAERRIAHMAHYDSLTDLPNRVLFFEHLRSALSRVPTQGGIAVCISMSTASRPSTIPMDTRSGTGCSKARPADCDGACATWIPSLAWAVMSSP
jgi:PAS domain S-box-containing protein